MPDDIIRNKNRLFQKQQKPYEPEYVRHNIKPLKSPPARHNDRISVATNTSRNPIKQAHEETMAINGESFDEEFNKIQVEDGMIIDNNDYVNFDIPSQSFRGKTDPTNSVVQTKIQENNNNIEESKTNNEDSSPAVGDYILMVSGKMILTGALELIQNKVKDILYDENDHTLIDDIVVLKRVEIKVGVFLGE